MTPKAISTIIRGTYCSVREQDPPKCIEILLLHRLQIPTCFTSKAWGMGYQVSVKQLGSNQIFTSASSVYQRFRICGLRANSAINPT
jgi:hypothetical protein